MSWRSSTLGEISDEANGIIQTGPFGSQLHESDYSETGVPVVMPKDIADGRITTESVARVGVDHVARLSRHKLAVGDIVYGRRGDIGRQALVHEGEAGWLCGTGCLRISLGDSVLDPTYLHYYLRQASVIGWIAGKAIGATMPNLNTTILRSVPVRYPNLSRQRRIASVLSAYDVLIENNLRRIRILEEVARALYREWFVNFRFPGSEQGESTPSAAGSLPSGWSVDNLVNVCTLTMGQSPKSEFYNTTGEGLPFHQGVSDFGVRFPENRLYCSVPARVAEAGDILFSVRAPVGRMNMARERLIIGRGLSALRHKGGHQEFLWEQLRDKFHEEDMMGNGAIFAAVTKNEMEKVQLICPSEAVISAATAHLRPLHIQVVTLSAAVRNLRRTRDLLLPRLFSGLIDLDRVPAA